MSERKKNSFLERFPGLFLEKVAEVIGSVTNFSCHVFQNNFFHNKCIDILLRVTDGSAVFFLAFFTFYDTFNEDLIHFRAARFSLLNISIIMPTLMATMGTTSRGWTSMMVIIGLPLTVIDMGRFIFVKEVKVVPDEKIELLTMKDFLPALKGKYIWLLVIITIFVNLITNINSA